MLWSTLLRRMMKCSWSMARKQYGCTVAFIVSVTLVVATVLLCVATKQWTVPNSVQFLTTFDPNVFPRQQTSIQNSSSSNRSSEESIPLPSREVVVPRKRYNYSNDERLFLDAIEASRRTPPAAAVPKIAFLFLVREDIVFEPLWRRYFAGHEGRYSLYVHA